MIGSTIGSYQVLSLLGAGGMGEVYRARDARLNRDVALKVLPASFSSDADRLRRFTLEAQTAGGLNHPNVLTIYEIGSHDGQPFLAAELLTGETLRAKIESGPIPLSKAIDYARQTAAGLAAAHARQITHRDIKPENLFVTTDGRVKILDFGLARQSNSGSGFPSGSHSGSSLETRLHTGTSPGVVLGTVGYMSPEQVRAQPVDHRSDLFSLGVVLYEMLSGTRPFAGESAVETMNAILTRDPPELTASGRALPPALAEVVRHSLEKQPDERFQSARDLAFALQAASGPSSGSAASMTTATAASGGGMRGARRAMPIAAAAALVGAIAGAGALWFAMPAREDLDLRNRRFTPLATDATVEERPTWSPDGRGLAYFSSVGPIASLLIKDLDASAPVTLVRNLRGARDIFWWPDGNRVGFVNNEGAWLVSRAGGDPEQLQAGNFPTVSLSPDGRTLALWTVTTTELASTTALWLASPPNATPVKYTRAFTESGVTTPIYVRYAPDGSRLLISGFLPDPANPTDQPPSVWEITGSSIETMGPPRRVFPTVRWVAPAFSWLRDGRRVVLSSEGVPGLWLGDLGRDTLSKITDGLGGEHEPSVSPDGRRIAFESRRDNYDTIEIPLDGSSIVDVLAASPEEVGATRTRDGRIVYVSNAAGHHEIRVRSADGTDRALVTPRDFPGEPDFAVSLLSPTVSPDGQRVLFARVFHSMFDAWISPISGGAPVRTTPEGQYAMMPEWSPDARWIAFTTIAKGGQWLSKQRIGSSEPSQVLANMTAAVSALAWSPDGAWIAHDSAAGVSIVAPEGGSDRVLAPKLRPRALAWSADARTLYGLVVDGDGARVVAVNVASGAVRVVRPLPPELVFTTPVTPGLRMTVNADGTRLLTTALRPRSDIWMMEGFEQ